MADIEKRTVQIDLEVDTKTVDSSKNPYQGWIHMARAVDAWRIFPRLFLSVYVFLQPNNYKDVGNRKCSYVGKKSIF